MLQAKHLIKKEKNDYRLIAISDIHGHLDRFKELLRKVNYDPVEDYLVIIGDFVEKGDQVLETIHFLMTLSQFPKCYILMGNCEWALSALLTIPEISGEIPKYLKRNPKNGIIRDLYNKHHFQDGHETPLGIQKIMSEELHQELKFISHLPTTLLFNDYLFVHAGVEPRDNYKQCGLSSYLEMQRFYELGHTLPYTVIVGHLPTSNYYPRAINNDIILDTQKKIICIDGGTGVKPISQLNALIISRYKDEITYLQESIQPFPNAVLNKDLYGNQEPAHKIAFPDFEVKMFKKGKDFSECFRISDHVLISIKNEFLYKKNGHLYCLDDYTDHWIIGEKGTEVKIAGIYGNYAYIICGKQVGWVHEEDIDY